MLISQSIQEQFTKSQKERQKCREAGISWPPEPWQRVEIFGNRYRSDPPGPVLGTLLYSNGGYYYVVPDCIEPDNPYPRECYDSELRPLFDDTAQGWVPYRFWANCTALQLARTTTYDVQLHNGTWAFECFAKPQPAGGYQFQEIGKPYRRYWHHEVVKLRPSE